jgi:hypothetical protein
MYVDDPTPFAVRTLSQSRTKPRKPERISTPPYDNVLEQFALELLVGADQNSEWSNGNLVIAANHGPIHLLQAAFYAVRLEVQRRKAA